MGPDSIITSDSIWGQQGGENERKRRNSWKSRKIAIYLSVPWGALISVLEHILFSGVLIAAIGWVVVRDGAIIDCQYF